MYLVMDGNVDCWVLILISDIGLITGFISRVVKVRDCNYMVELHG